MKKIVLIAILLALVATGSVSSSDGSRKITMATKNITLTVDTNETDIAVVAIADDATNKIEEFCIYVRGDAIKMINPSLMK